MKKGKRSTRVFRNKAGTYCVSVQGSFVLRRDADRMARAVDHLKSKAAVMGTTLSVLLASAIEYEAGVKP